MSLPPVFKAVGTSRAPRAPVTNHRIHRTSPRSRGYSARWDKASLGHRKHHPFCVMCEQEGRDNLGDKVDHILPATEFPDLFWDHSNWQTICHSHDAMKQAMEAFARKWNMVEKLKLWCSSLNERPKEFTNGTTPKSAFD